MIEPATVLHKLLMEAGIPFTGVSIGKLDDKSTWVIRFAPNVTDAQRRTAAAILANIDPNAPDPIDLARARLAELRAIPAKDRQRKDLDEIVNLLSEIVR